MSKLYLLSAPSGAGKTTFCSVIADQARATGWDVAGVLSPPVFENGIKTGILARDFRTNESRALAISTIQSPNANYQLPLGNWFFSSSTISWANEIFAASLPCDLFIVDELGPLELIRREGWLNALKALRRPDYKIGVVVIRPGLLETACEVLPIDQVITKDISGNSIQQARAWWSKIQIDKNKH